MNKNTLDRLGFWSAVTLLLLVIFFHFIVSQASGPLWRVEANSANLASMPFSDSIHKALQYDSFPVGGPFVFRLFSHISASDRAFRILGFIIGILILGSLFFTGRLLGLSLPIISIFLFELNPFVLRHGDSLRPHGLGLIFVILSMGLLWKLATETKSWKRFIATAIIVIASVQFSYQDSVLIFAICTSAMLVTLMRKDYKSTLLVLSTGILSALSLLPYIPVLRHAATWTALIQYNVNFKAVLNVFAFALKAPEKFIIWIWISLFILVLIWFLNLFLKKLVSPQQAEKFIFLLIIIELSTVGTIMFLGFSKVITEPRYYLSLMAVIAISFDSMYTIVLKNRSVLNLIVLAAAIVIIPSVWRDIHVRMTNIDQISQIITSRANKNDLIVITPWYLATSFNRVYRGETSSVAIPPLSDLTIQRYDLLNQAISDKNSETKVLTEVRQTLISGNKVWLIRDINSINSPYYFSGLKEWNSELSDILELHTKNSQQEDLQIKEPIDPDENPTLIQFNGWK